MTEPHRFVGRLDRWCEVCDRPDRDAIHVWTAGAVPRTTAEIEEAVQQAYDDPIDGYEAYRQNKEMGVYASEPLGVPGYAGAKGAVPDQREAADAALRAAQERARRVVEVYGEYVEATAGRGHDGPHDTSLLLLGTRKPRQEWSTRDEQEACGACASAQYGTEADLTAAIAALAASPETGR